jgi:hypothetical protein
MPYLVTVSGERIPLKEGQDYVAGRGRSCDLVVADRASSRRHARLVVRRERILLEDLGSHNGTYLNGVLVRGRVAARDGNRIQFGSAVFLLRTRDPADDQEETGTLGFEEPSPVIDMGAGEMASVGVPSLLRYLHEGAMDATLHVAFSGGRATVEVRGGEAVRAECDGLEGFNALVRLARQTRGIYWIVPGATPCEVNVDARTARLLADLERCVAPTPAVAAAPRR